MQQTFKGTKAMVVSPHYLASAAGARALARGGNAFDAAVAVSACLAVVYPHMTGLGGDAFWLAYRAGEGKVRAYNASGRSAYAASLARYAGHDAIPVRGPLAALTVPGMVDGWDAVLRQYGRLGLAEALEPAIAYAADGFPLSADQHANTAAHAAVLERYPSTAAVYLPSGRVPKAGERFVQRQLAASLKLIAEQGRDAFYRGGIARAIANEAGKHGGPLSEDDFADHEGDWVDPISTTYRGYDVYQMPPNSQGFAALMALNIAERFDLSAIEHGSPEYYHLLIEAIKLSFRDRNRYLTDPAFAAIPLDRLLDKSYAAELADSIRMDRTVDVDAVPQGNDTAYAAVVDEEGNAVSFIQSLYFEFGSGFIPGDTGILLQNRGSFFSLDPNHVNRLAPHKRTFHTLAPAMALRDGKPAFLYGTQGGEGQPQTQTAVFTRMVDYGMDPLQAVSEPRWVWGRTWGAPTKEVKLEGRIAPEVAEALRAAGHQVNVVQPWDGVMGHAHAIAIDERGFPSGGADPRSDGAAIGW